jgi:ribosomal protein S18 acetylase RimI-like enzyme
MNFYSNEIINNIIDNSELEELIDNLDIFYESTQIILQKYSYLSISPFYTRRLLNNKNNNVVFRCIDHYFEIDNCPSMMVYNKQINREKHEINYYMLFICTKYKFKNQGYASQLLDDFIQKMREKHATDEIKNTCKIILSSLWNAATFYESYGFKWARHDTILNHPILLKYEKYEENKEYIIMELEL